MRVCKADDVPAGVRGRLAEREGFSLLELLIAMAIGMVVLGAMYSVFTVQNKTFSDQDEVVALQQSVRAGLDMIAQEARMAGYDPVGIGFDGITVNAGQLQMKSDLDGNGAIDLTSRENVIYKFAAAENEITRNIGAGDQILVENVESFTFEYRDSSGALTAASAAVRQIRITITGRTEKPDPDYTDPVYGDNYRRYTLSTLITPRNLAY